ncbi:GGDEF domain-containing protein [Bowmanella denitrificans]|uniref:GGDEF domain-containing protein n=1 Tax=Bowmanella denitrificans TaxID=366582 RepID=UPI0031DBCB22
MRFLILSAHYSGRPFFVGVGVGVGAWLIVNALVTCLITVWVLADADKQIASDWLGASLAWVSALAIGFSYVLVSFILLKRHIKVTVLLGLLLLQQARYLDGLDQVLLLRGQGMDLAEDVLFLLGALILASGITLWVIFTYRLSTLDKLTRVHNRRYFDTALQQHLLFRRQEPHRGCLLVMDVDDFKKINDDFGHAMGDKVLKILGAVLSESARREDIVCRSGGEEFEILLVRVAPDTAMDVARRLMTKIADATPHSLPILTVSMGLTAIRAQDSVDSLRRRADKAMYQAKEQGKACIVQI